MANYYATARSNYFRVKDPKEFEEWCGRYRLDFWRDTSADEMSDFYAISPEYGSGDAWPRWEVAEDGEDREIDFELELAPHLDPRDVAILFEVGNEKLRYLFGEAIAVHNSGKIVRVSLDDIYDKAISEFEDNVIVRGATY